MADSATIAWTFIKTKYEEDTPNLKRTLLETLGERSCKNFGQSIRKRLWSLNKMLEILVKREKKSNISV